MQLIKIGPQSTEPQDSRSKQTVQKGKTELGGRLKHGHESCCVSIRESEMGTREHRDRCRSAENELQLRSERESRELPRFFAASVFLFKPRSFQHECFVNTRGHKNKEKVCQKPAVLFITLLLLMLVSYSESIYFRHAQIACVS